MNNQKDTSNINNQTMIKVFEKIKIYINNRIRDTYNIVGLDKNYNDYKFIEKTHKERKNLLNYLKKIRIISAIKSIYSFLFLFFSTEKPFRRVINIGKNIKYEGNDKDRKFIEYTIKSTPIPETKSIMTYFLGRIKDKKMVKVLKKFNKKPDQFTLFLQQCKKGDVMLTNALNTDGSSSLFKELTQAVSGSRRCHSLIVSDILTDKNGIIKDLKIIQSTLAGGVHETSFKEYIKNNYSKSDFLLASFPKNKRKSIILNAKNHIGQKYDRISMILDIVTGGDFKDSGKDIQNINKTYCTALVFDAAKKSGCNIPKPHLTPSDILLIKDLTPKYACYCDKL